MAKVVQTSEISPHFSILFGYKEKKRYTAKGTENKKKNKKTKPSLKPATLFHQTQISLISVEPQILVQLTQNPHYPANKFDPCNLNYLTL